MNFLGHFFLSFHNNELLTGNFIADFIKGNQYKKFSAGIAKGIMMHRFIDEVTDAHPSSATCRNLLRPITGKFSGVALDMIYDHVLAKNWNQYSATPLNIFADKVYATLETQIENIPSATAQLLYHMKKENWLCRYVTLDGMQKSLTGMHHRIKSENNLDKVMLQFQLHQSKIGNEFEIFFADIQQQVKAFDLNYK